MLKNNSFSHFSSLNWVGIQSGWLAGQPFRLGWGLQAASSPWTEKKKKTPKQQQQQKTSNVCPALAARLLRTAAVWPSCHEWEAMATELCKVSPPKLHTQSFFFGVCSWFCSLRHFLEAQDGAFFKKGDCLFQVLFAVLQRKPAELPGVAKYCGQSWHLMVVWWRRPPTV